MEFVRLTNPLELFACEKQIRPLFEKYYERASGYLENLEPAEIIWQKVVTTLNSFHLYPNYYFYLLREDTEFVGFVIGNLVRIPELSIFFMGDYYIPKKGKLFAQYMKLVQQILGADEIWGQAPENIFRVYRKILKDSFVKKFPLVRIKL